jgi:hypothetical protein
MNLDEYNQFEHKIVTLGLVGGKKFPPLFMYDYEFDTDEEFPEPLYEIIVDGPAEHPGPYTLIATQWHPILRHLDSVTFASLLEEHSPVHLFSGEGFVRSVRKVRQDRVVGLALCDSDSASLGDPPYTEDDGGLRKILDTLNDGAGMWADFGLGTKENIIFTESIATGTLTFQYRLKGILTRDGLKLPPDPPR